MYVDWISGDLGALRVGDQVMVKTHSADYEGEVVKKGKYLRVKYLNGREDNFRKDTGREATAGLYGIFSMDQWNRNQWVESLKRSLRNEGIDLRNGHTLTMETMEKVLDVVRKEKQS